ASRQRKRTRLLQLRKKLSTLSLHEQLSPRSVLGDYPRQTGKCSSAINPPDGSLFRRISPALARATLRAIVKPRPKPPESRFLDFSARLKRLNISSIWSGGIPGPLSFTLSTSSLLSWRSASFALPPRSDE